MRNGLLRNSSVWYDSKKDGSVVDRSHSYGYVSEETLSGWGSVEWQTGMDPRRLKRLCELMIFLQDTPVKVGVVMEQDKDYATMVFKHPDLEDGVFAIAPNLRPKETTETEP